VIEFRDVSFAYIKGVPAVDIPELSIGPGLTLVVGPNGAGKSTLLRLAAGVERPHRGTVAIDGLDLWIDEVAARRNLAYVPEQPELTPYATIAEILQLVAGLRGTSVETEAEALVQVGLSGLSHRTVRELSRGQRRRAVLATALIGTPSVLLLDEPLETMDLGMRRFVQTLARDHRDRGGTVVIATHEIEPFAADTDVVIAMHGARATVTRLEPASLPVERLRAIEALARGDGM
jgi:ABC-2 type transport system ATP-binding protein